jgi:quercetin dioxygenase-like cupin family protein
VIGLAAAATRRISAIRAIASAVLMTLLVAADLHSQEKRFSNVMISQETIGAVPAGRYAFRASVTTVDPGAQIPFHVHEYPGIRYMLEGALTISWKDNSTQTYSAGSTYYEGAGVNHPTREMSVSNPLNVPARVLIIELVPTK